MSSSFVFVIVIAIWVVYLALHVVRRREHLATARNVDRFSEHMKVLQRRAVRNAPRTQLKSSVNLVRGRETVFAHAEAPHSASIALPRETVAEAASVGPVEFEPVGPLAPQPQPATSAINLTWPFALLGDLTTARALRAATLVLSVVLASLVGVFVMVGMLPWWALTVAITGLGVVLVWLPRAARAERVARERRMRSRVQSAVPTVQTDTAADSFEATGMGYEPAAASEAATAYGADPGLSAETRSDEQESLARRTADRIASARRIAGRVSAKASVSVPEHHELVDDIEFVDAESVAATSLADPRPRADLTSSTSPNGMADDVVKTSDASLAARTAATQSGGRSERASQLFDRTEHEEAVTAPTWQPVPVPPPTYTLKARAPQEEPEFTAMPAAVSTPAPVMPPIDPSKPIPIDIDDDLEWAHAHRKVVNG